MDPDRENFKKSAAAFAGVEYKAPVVNTSPPKQQVDTNTGLYKLDQKRFYGGVASELAETESQGS